MGKQNGYAEVLVPLIILLISVWWLIGQWQKSEAHKQAFDSWTTDCYYLGGEIKTSGANTVDCFVNDEPCRISGYEKWESVNPNPYFRNLAECTAK